LYEQYKNLKEDAPEDIYKVNLISEVKDRMGDIWIPCWFSPKQCSLFWVEDLKISDLQASFYCPSSYQTIKLFTVLRAGYSPVKTTPTQSRRRSWSGCPSGSAGRLELTTGSNKENQYDKWMIGYISGLFNPRSPSQKVFFQAAEARRVGIRTVIPVFLQDLDLDVTAPFHILSVSKFRFSLPPSSQTQRLVVDYTGALLSVTFKKSPSLLPVSASASVASATTSFTQTQDFDHLSQQRKNLLSQSPPSVPVPATAPASSQFFHNCTHFHSLEDITTLESILSKLDLEDFSSRSEWIPILDKDSNLLPRELYQILIRSLSATATATAPPTTRDKKEFELELQVAQQCAALIVLCWRIHPDGALCGGTRLTDNLFNKILTLLSRVLTPTTSSSAAILAIATPLDSAALIPLILLATHIARQADLNLTDATEAEEEAPGKLLLYLLSNDGDWTSLSEGLSSLLASLWFRNIMRQHRVCCAAVPPLVSSFSSSSPLLFHSQLSAIVTASASAVASERERRVLSDLFGIPSASLTTLIPLLCAWMSHLLRSSSFPSERIVTIRLMTTSLTLLLLIQQSPHPSPFVSPISFSVDWDLVHLSLSFLSAPSPSGSANRGRSLDTMTQLIDFLSFIFVELHWLRNQHNGSLYRDTILQVLPPLLLALTLWPP
jgi:hypothetical protein